MELEVQSWAEAEFHEKSANLTRFEPELILKQIRIGV